jgi:hypothetical protein
VPHHHPRIHNRHITLALSAHAPLTVLWDVAVKEEMLKKGSSLLLKTGSLEEFRQSLGLSSA